MSFLGLSERDCTRLSYIFSTFLAAPKRIELLLTEIIKLPTVNTPESKQIYLVLNKIIDQIKQNKSLKETAISMIHSQEYLFESAGKLLLGAIESQEERNYGI